MTPQPDNVTPFPFVVVENLKEDLANYKKENREDDKEIWAAINKLRWQMALIFGGLALIAIEIPIVMTILVKTMLPH